MVKEIPICAEYRFVQTIIYERGRDPVTGEYPFAPECRSLNADGKCELFERAESQ